MSDQTAQPEAPVITDEKPAPPIPEAPTESAESIQTAEAGETDSVSDTESVHSTDSGSSGSDVEKIEEKLLTMTAEMANIELKDKLSGDDTSEEEMESLKWLQQETERLRSKLLAKLPEDKKEQWQKKGTDLLQEHGLLQIGNEVKDRIMIKGKDILAKNPQLRNKMKEIMKNTEALDKMKEKLGELAEENKEVIDKAKNALAAYTEDENSKLLIEKTKAQAQELLNSEEGKELVETSKKLATEFAESKTAKDIMEKLKKTWEEKHDTLMEKGEELVDKTVNLATDENVENKGKDLVTKAKDKMKDVNVNEQVGKVAKQGDALLDKALENKEMITKKGLDILETIQKDEAAKKLMNKGLDMMKKVEEDGGVEKLLEKSKDKLEELRKDDKKRDEFITSIKDTALNFLLQYLPKIQVPVITGTKKGVDYQLENLSLGGFHVKSDHVKVALDLNKGALNGSILRLAATKIKFTITDLKWSYKKGPVKGSGTADCFSEKTKFGVQFLVTVEDDKPVLKMRYPYVQLDTLKLEIKGSSLSWVFNLLISLFQSTVKQKIESTLIETLVEKTDALLGPMNGIMSQYWPTLVDIIGLDEKVIKGDGTISDIASTPTNSDLLGEDDKDGDNNDDDSYVEYSFTFQEGPLGIVLLNTEKEADQKGSARVSKFNKGSFKKKLQAEKSKMIQIGDIVSKIDNESVIHLTYGEIIGRLKNLPRPLVVHFIRSAADALGHDEPEEEGEEGEEGEKEDEK